jgi:hypothetical protein
MMKMSEENARVEDDAMKISDLGGSMSEAVELKMDELTVLKMRKLMKMLLTEKERRFQIF